MRWRQNVDNSQIVLSPDNHVYRLILTTSTTYFNGKMDVNIYIVEALTRPDQDDLTTTRLLKGLELASRFRFSCRQGPRDGTESPPARRAGSGTP
jgi:hypothetical protein